MFLTNEELDQIVNALGIPLPIRGVERQLNCAYKNQTLNANQILRDIETGRLVIRPDRVCWEILRNNTPDACVYDYVFILRDNAFFECFDPFFFIQEYELSDKGIDTVNKEIAVKTIYDCLMEIGEDAMRIAANEAGVGERWYNDHRFKLRCEASKFVDDVLARHVRLASGRNQKEVFVLTISLFIQKHLGPDKEAK